jgi:glycosyltransferase involved in cell wall biosynthesis
VLIRAFAASVAERQISLVIVGDGPERGALVEEARRHGVERLVDFPGFVENPWSYFARAAAFVCSSRWEGFGNVIVEAMACGAPVVATDCDFGPREIVRPGDSGLLVPVENVEALANAIVSVVDNRDLATRLGEGGRQRARDFDVAHMTRAYERMFRELSVQL